MIWLSVYPNAPCDPCSLARGFEIVYETPKSDKLSLFHLGERQFDHVVFLPTKIKGKNARNLTRPIYPQ